MRLSTTTKWIGLALVGLAIAAVVAVAASNLVSRQIGIASESVSAGEALAPAVESAARRAETERKGPEKDPPVRTAESEGGGGGGNVESDDGAAEAGGTPSGGGSEESADAVKDRIDAEEDARDEREDAAADQQDALEDLEDERRDNSGKGSDD
ncbi:MAG TPA: hypothetical protein VD761_11420 [Solirubrobacterales bacterium]|nr:hypothetical protein [Solirubrobacterales bacterium]